MAQLDKFTFLDQSFLILLSFFLLYILHSRILIPYIAITLKVRTKILTFLIKQNSIYIDLSGNIFFSNVKTCNLLLSFIYNKLIIVNTYLIIFFKQKKI